ncbi:hypothetical protein, partial [Aeromicrobium sp. Root344]|uniref:hypothetical protein n=1 Tax=Aeromicrobium sp. Root344 TaxID=1736521 RepID=UPI001F2C4D58
MISIRTLAAVAVTSALVLTGGPAQAKGHHGHHPKLSPRTHFVMQPDGSSGLKADGAGIPNIDSVKKTIAAYYGDPGTGIADKASSPYISEMDRIVARATKNLQATYDREIRQGKKPAIVFDADDTTLWTYDMEVAGMHFTFDP